MARNQRGDTLVEVLMAIVILGTVIVGAIAIMNRGLASAQVALEHSQVRLAINAQLEMLRKARDEYARDPASVNGQTWRSVVDTAPETGTLGYAEGCTSSQTATDFFMNIAPITGGIQRQNYTGSPPAGVPAPGNGLWVEAKKSPTPTPPATPPAYIDFVIRACWTASGSGGQQRTVTGVRLYDPYR